MLNANLEITAISMHLELCFKKPYTEKGIRAVRIFNKKIKYESFTDINRNTS